MKWWLMLATLVGLGGFSGAVQARQPTEADGTGEAREDSITKYGFLAKTARDKKDHGEALEYYAKLLAYVPDNQKAHYFVGRMRFDRGEMALAKEALLHSAELDSLHRNTNLTLLQVYMDEGQADSSWIALRRVIASGGEDDNTWQYRRKVADMYRTRGRTRQAIAHYGALIAVDDSTGADAPQDLLSMLVRLHRQLGEADQALAWQRRLLAAQAGDGDGGSVQAGVDDRKETLLGMVDLMVQQGDVTAALNTLRQLAAIDEKGRYGHFHRMFELAEESGDAEVCTEALEGKVSANPRDVESLASLIELCLHDAESLAGEEMVLAAQGMALAEQETALVEGEAALARKEALRARPKSPELLAELEGASRWLVIGLAANPGNPRMHLLKGHLLVLRGDEEGALASYEVAKGDPAWAGVAQQRIWQIRPPETEEEKLRRQFFGGDEKTPDE